MTYQKEIDSAISSHNQWKNHLREAIATGICTTPIESIRDDCRCEFGLWLHGDTLSPNEKASPRYKIVCRLHAEFHKLAAKVAELTQAGNISDAEKMMNNGGEYLTISKKLILAMEDWKKISKE